MERARHFLRRHHALSPERRAVLDRAAARLQASDYLSEEALIQLYRTIEPLYQL